MRNFAALQRKTNYAHIFFIEKSFKQGRRGEFFEQVDLLGRLGSSPVPCAASRARPVCRCMYSTRGPADKVCFNRPTSKVPRPVRSDPAAERRGPGRRGPGQRHRDLKTGGRWGRRQRIDAGQQVADVPVAADQFATRNACSWFGIRRSGRAGRVRILLKKNCQSLRSRRWIGFPFAAAGVDGVKNFVSGSPVGDWMIALPLFSLRPGTAWRRNQSVTVRATCRW